MKLRIIILSLLFIVGCGNHETGNSEKKTSADSGSDNDTVQLIKDSIPLKEHKVSKDTQVLMLSKQILTAIKNKDYKIFADFIHPVLGIRFSPYGNIDTANDIKLSSEKFLGKIRSQDKINWGTYDGSGEEILLTIEQYFKKFVYNADFLNAEKTSLNKMIGAGNSLNNLETIYRSCDFTESYFSGFDKKYDGMDWCCLRLVFKNYNDKIYLVGIVHDQWTI